MKRCPYCGVKNLDTDQDCFNCEKPLEGPRLRGSGAVAAPVSEPSPARPRRVELDTERRPRRAAAAEKPRLEETATPRVTSPGTLPALALANLATKLLFFLSSLGLFFIASLFAIWFAYESLTGAVIAFSIFVVGFVVSVIYPDIRMGARAGRTAWSLALAMDLVFLTLAMLPILFYLAHKGFIAGVGPFIKQYWWALMLLPAMGALSAYLAGSRR
ncbi:MAG: zinc ribbon domain-containing protein [Candidatus Geothermincolia bacterium]